MHEVPEGLRERKKQRTREAIVDAAMTLFRERGFERTTVADIAQVAGIAPRTFFGYFAAKEDVVFHDADELVASLERRLRGRPDSETAFDALRAWVLDIFGAGGPDAEAERARRELILATPALQARERAQLARFEQLLTEGAARDLGASPDDLQPRLVGAAATAALDALGRFYEDAEATDVPDAGAVMDEALVFLRGGLEALRETASLPVPPSGPRKLGPSGDVTSRSSGRSRRA